MWRDRQPDRFIIGVNLPWVSYGTDVGSSAWYPDGGLSRQPAQLEKLNATFETLSRDGISIVRAFLLCDARSGVVFDRDGVPEGLDHAVFPDIDAIVAAARRHRIALMPVLLDFLLCGAARIVNGVQTGGRSRLITDPDARAATIDRVLLPIAHRYADEDAIVAWDVINEPEWCLGRRGPLSRQPPIPFDTLQRFLSDAVNAIKATARQPVTIGCAGTWKLELVRPLGLDFYQIHWYDRFGWKALVRPVSELRLSDRPVILGEFAGRSTRLPDVLDAAKGAGYEGALVWSVLADDPHSAYPPGFSSWTSSAP
jgi:hypothetical protein